MKIDKNIVILTLTFLLLLVLISACTNQDIAIIDAETEKIEVNLEIADTNEERALGLMFRTDLEENSGMLFVYEEENYYSFWMKNTLIPLDMIWISKELEIVDIKHAEPCKSDPCLSYKPANMAKYVLEVNSGFTNEKGIKIGDKIAFNKKY